MHSSQSVWLSGAAITIHVACQKPSTKNELGTQECVDLRWACYFSALGWQAARDLTSPLPHAVAICA